MLEQSHSELILTDKYEGYQFSFHVPMDILQSSDRKVEFDFAYW